jgi:hypothetical protein
VPALTTADLALLSALFSILPKESCHKHNFIYVFTIFIVFLRPAFYLAEHLA